NKYIGYQLPIERYAKQNKHHVARRARLSIKLMPVLTAKRIEAEVCCFTLLPVVDTPPNHSSFADYTDGKSRARAQSAQCSQNRTYRDRIRKACFHLQLDRLPR